MTIPMGAIEAWADASMSVDEVQRQVANAAGLPRRLVKIMWSEKYPRAHPYVIVLELGPDFHTGRRPTERVVYVGRDWLREQRPQLWAVLVAWRLQGGGDPFA